ncbi:MAG: hypothetical protein JW395_4110 [Nitrospira sp.]|nr:hypothetical protein [Nitrospira sp.]
MMASSPPYHTHATRRTATPAMFELLTDILADLVLEDLRQSPQIPTDPYIDRVGAQENTGLLTQERST